MTVTIVRVYRFSCDRAGCTAESAGYTPPDGQPAPLRWAKQRAVESEGWRFPGKLTLCPRAARRYPRQALTL